MPVTYQQITIAGQTTAIVTEKLDQLRRVSSAQKIMRGASFVEQVGFLDRSALPYPTFSMMGEELSLIGSLAAGYKLLSGKTGQIRFLSSGVSGPITVKLNRLTCNLQFPAIQVIKQKPNRVSLGGITFQIIDRLPKDQVLLTNEQELLQQMLFNSPAAGIVFYQENQIYPVVKVKKTNTLVWESACGSGSVAFYFISGCSKVVQPSGAVLTVSRENGTLLLSVLRKGINYET